MSPRFSQFLTAILLFTVAGLVPSIAEGGYVRITDLSSSPLAIAQGHGAGTSDDSQIEHNGPDRPDLVLGGDAAGATSPSTSGPSSSAGWVAILPDAGLSGRAQLVQRLGPAGKVWLPPGFLSGVFRPPRF